MIWNYEAGRHATAEEIAEAQGGGRVVETAGDGDYKRLANGDWIDMKGGEWINEKGSQRYSQIIDIDDSVFADGHVGDFEYCCGYSDTDVIGYC